MKSAYELAMERLSKSAPVKSLSAAQKTELAEVESLFKSKIAQAELALRDDLAKAEAAGNSEKADELRRQFKIDRQRLEDEREAKKNRIRGE